MKSVDSGVAESRLRARIREVFAPLDRARDLALDLTVREGGRCRYCGRTLADSTLARHPGRCAQQTCRRAAEQEMRSERFRAAQDARLAALVADLPAPPVELPPRSRR